MSEDTATQTLVQARPDSQQAKRDRLPAILEEYAKDIEHYGRMDSGLAPTLRRAARCLTEQAEQVPCQSTDVEIWRETPDDYYSPSIHVTQSGGVGINVGGYVIVKPVRDWHGLAVEPTVVRESNQPEHTQTGNCKQGGLDNITWCTQHHAYRRGECVECSPCLACTPETMLGQSIEQAEQPEVVEHPRLNRPRIVVGGKVL